MAAVVRALLDAAAWYYRAIWLPLVTPCSAGAPPPKTAARAVPVVTAIAKQRDMNLFLNGLGTVTAFKTVTIRSRVDGELMKVAFDEGQMVREGELLAEMIRVRLRCSARASGRATGQE